LFGGTNIEKRAYFRHKGLPWLLIAPQLIITLVFFIWPASQALYQSLLEEDPFGLASRFVGLEHFQRLLNDPAYFRVVINTLVFAAIVCGLALLLGLLFAVAANRILFAANTYKTLLVWPYAVAPAIAGILWWLIFNPTIGSVGELARFFGFEWNPFLNGNQAMLLLVTAATWKQISYNFLFFLAGLQSIPRSLIEAAAIDGARPWRRFWTIVFPMLSPVTFFLIVVNMVYAFFDTFGVVHATTEGGPAGATQILVYKVYQDGFIGLDLGGSAAQSVILMLIVITLTSIQFRYIERRVHY
jgi:sn-glycerol 3-phosphate transport system permease protein